MKRYTIYKLIVYPHISNYLFSSYKYIQIFYFSKGLNLFFLIYFQELREAFSPHKFILTAALGAGKDTMEVAYDLRQLNKYLDYFHLMCYDYHGKWDKKTGANAPLMSADKHDYYTVVSDTFIYRLQFIHRIFLK